MGYAEKHNIAFIHIPKNAGKSLENALKITALKDQTRRHQPRWLAQKLHMLTKAADFHALRKKGFGDGFTNINLTHLTYLEMRQHLNIPENATWLACVRNPVTRMESLYRHHAIKKDGHYLESFADFVSRFIREAQSQKTRCAGRLAHQRIQSQYLEGPDGKIVQGICILRYETLNKDYENFIKKRKINSPLEWHEKKIGHHNEGPERSITWSNDTKDKVYDFYRKDFENFGYEQT